LNITKIQGQKSMTIVITVRILLFILFSAPIAIAGGYYLSDLVGNAEGKLLLSIFNFLRFTHHSFNIIVLSVFNKIFQQTLIAHSSRLVSKCKVKLQLKHITAQSY
jgi:hypothetical protein